MKTGLTYVQSSKFLAICNQLNLTVIEQPSQFRVECPTDKTRRMYFGKGKKGVCLVDISGFTSEFAITHPKPPTSKVTQCLDFTAPEKIILRSFYKTAKLLIAEVVAPIAPLPEVPVTEPVAEEPVAS